jgi:curved DNA-binding protein CbpA
MERRNLYRILHVQPEAPAEVIKAAYRALMSTLRMHPDLGGDHAVAAKLNAAYATLSDPASRRAYDLSLRRPARRAAGDPGGTTATAPAPARPPATWLADRRCPLCGHGFTAKPEAQTRCSRCDSPLAAAPADDGGATHVELIGRRRNGRVLRSMPGWLRLNGTAGDLPVQLNDLSLTGLSLTSPRPLAAGSAFRLVTTLFDAVAWVVNCHARDASHRVHAQLLTLQLLRNGKGVFVSVKA